jgi:hypothetical protein
MESVLHMRSKGEKLCLADGSMRRMDIRMNKKTFQETLSVSLELYSWFLDKLEQKFLHRLLKSREQGRGTRLGGMKDLPISSN